MAASFMKKTMAYLGLVDDDYDDYDDYDSRSPSPVGRVAQRSAGAPEEVDEPPAAPKPRIRTLTRDETTATAVAAPAPTVPVTGRPTMGWRSVCPVCVRGEF